MNYKSELYRLPPHMRGAMERWIENGIPPGSFLSALLSNDFMGAMGRADDENASALKSYATFLYSYAPSGCFGSQEKFLAWERRGGLSSMEKVA